MTGKGSVRVAILGGGLAGAAVLRGLSRHAHLKVDIFESAPAFREAGQGIGFNHNAVWALELLGLRQCLSDSGAIRINSMRPSMGYGPETGKFLYDSRHRERGTWITQRAVFLNEIYKTVDPAVMHTSKKLLRLEEHSDDQTITLYFEDGTTHVCDVLIGADGIHSCTRKYVLRESDTIDPTFAGWWAVWTLVPFEQAQKHLGAQLIDPKDPRQYMWIGPNGAVMHDLLANNTLVQCVVAQRAPENDLPIDSWMKTVDKDHLTAHLQDWDPRLQKGMIDLVTENGSTRMLSLWHHKPSSRIAKDSIALVGDAAGATTPWQGSGGGMAMEDALLLSELFGQVHDAATAKAALAAYEHVNKPRRDKLIASSYETGLLFTGCHPEVLLDSAKLKERLQPKWDWIVDVDLTKNKDEAMDYMRSLLS